MAPGDFIEIRAQNVATYGIILPFSKGARRAQGPKYERSHDALHASQFALLTNNGDIFECGELDAMFKISFHKAFPDVDIRLLTQAGLSSNEVVLLAEGIEPSLSDASEQQTQDVIRARISLSFAMNRFLRQAEILAVSHRQAFLSLISVFPQLEEHYWSLSTEQVATMLQHNRLLLPDELDKLLAASPPSALSRFVTHQLLMLKHEYFMCDADSHASSQIWNLRPERERRDLRAVEQWLQQIHWKLNLNTDGTPMDPVHSFIARAQQAIVNGGKVHWSDDDKTILSVLLDSFSSARLLQPDIYHHITSFFTKALHFVSIRQPGSNHQVAYSRFRDDDWKRENGLLSVAKSDLLSLIKALHIFPEHLTDWSLLSDSSKRLLESSLLNRRKLLKAQPPVVDDLDAHLRTTYDEDIFVIDDGNARELDDGISIGQPGPDGKVWIHVHIADPTCNLGPSDSIAQCARRQSTSLYFHNATLPMLAGRDFPGIASKTSPGPANALTFSALIDDQGLVHDIQVLPRKVTNQHILTYGLAADIINGKVQGHAFASKLSLLHKMTTHLRERRLRDGYFNAFSQHTDVRLEPSAHNKGALTTDGQLPFYLPSPLMLRDASIVAPLHSDGYVPELYGMQEYSLDLDYTTGVEHLSQQAPAKDLVAECMILAGRVAAAWGSRAANASPQTRHPLPVSDSSAQAVSAQLQLSPSTWSACPLALPYRMQTLEARHRHVWTQRIREIKDKDGNMPFQSIIANGIVIPSAELQATPGPHVALGVGTSSAGIFIVDEDTGKLRKGSSDTEPPRDLIDGCGYARVTSPLRRYNDLVAHWQIKAILHRAFPRPAQDEELQAKPKLREALEERKGHLVTASELQRTVQSLTRGEMMGAASEKNYAKQWTLKAIRLEMERAGLQQGTSPPALSGKPGKTDAEPEPSPPRGMHSNKGSLTLVKSPDSEISQAIKSGKMKAYTHHPHVALDVDTGRFFAKITLSQLGIRGFYPITTFVPKATLELAKQQFDYHEPNPNIEAEKLAGGKYSFQWSSGPPNPGNSFRLGQEFEVKLKRVEEEVVGGFVLAGRSLPEGIDAAERAKMIPSTHDDKGSTSIGM